MRHERLLIIGMGALGVLIATQLPMASGFILGWFSLAIIASVFIPAKEKHPYD